jgi:hypothetical protein
MNYRKYLARKHLTFSDAVVLQGAFFTGSAGVPPAHVTKEAYKI